MEAFVRRGPSERVDKTGVSKGRVLRPLNPFMLYRKAYGDLAKVVLGTNQRQMLSRYVGVSWGLEDESVLRQFRKLAEAENEAHRQLFPGWKYLRGYPLKKTD
ncbi:hypothetical protein GGS21DRAFT_535315 [Xylaria nigripes]|nr:hypothetical protein GGS21DRAFT_535315 [Xylaria nigripes]